MDSQQLELVRRGRRKFIAMAATYALGVFNDNYFKQAAALIAVSAGLSSVQGHAALLFSLPFVLFSAYAGWLADRFPKKNVVIAVKFLELVAMLIGAYGLITMHWNCILAMVFLMGLHSTIFGPALNGSIPELYPEFYVNTANAIIKLVTTLAILVGMAAAGFCLDRTWLATTVPFGRLLVAGVVVTVAVFGVVASFGGNYRRATGETATFPWLGPLCSARDLFELRQDPLLLMAVFCDMFFYFISLLAVLVINDLGVRQLGFSKTVTSLLSVALMIGVCLGSFAASRLTSSKRWTHVLAPGGLGMGVSMIAVGLLAALVAKVPFPALLLILTATGLFGGLFLIPVTSFIQIRPAADSKGRIIAVANFFAFCGMSAAGPIFNFLTARLQPSGVMICLGVIATLVAVMLGSWRALLQRTGQGE